MLDERVVFECKETAERVRYDGEPHNICVKGELPKVVSVEYSVNPPSYICSGTNVWWLDNFSPKPPPFYVSKMVGVSLYF